MRLTEKDKRVIARAANLLVERMIDDPESLPAAEFQASSMVRALQKTYGDNVIRMALENVMNQMLEARKLTNKKRVNEMGRLSTIHAGGVERRSADANKIAVARAKRAAFWTEDDVVSTLRDLTDDFAVMVYQQIEAFVDEVNEDSKTPLIAYKDVANEHIAKKGFLFLVGFSDSEDGGSGSFNAAYGIGYPSILRNVEDEGEYCIIECDGTGEISNLSEIAQFLNTAKGRPVQACYSTTDGDLRFFFEFENYEPMAKAGVWNDVLDKKSNPAIGNVIGTITGKGKYEVEEAAVVSTDDLFRCLERDDVFADWLMTGNWDPSFDPESGEYMEDEIDESVSDFSSKTYVQGKILMGRLLKIAEGKCRHSLSQEVDFVNKSLTKVNKAKLKEDRYASLDDELSAIENGGWDMFDNSDLADPDMADRIHRNASYEGMSDLDYVNREELLDGIEDDLAYEVERNGNINYAETPFRGYKDIFDDMKMELDAEGKVRGSYGHIITTVDDLANEVLGLELDAIYDEWGIDIPFASDINHCFTVEKALKHLAPYANDNYPSCKSFFETLMNISKEYNATVTEFNLKWPPLVRIPDQAGTLEENSVSGSLPASVDSFLQDVAQMYGGIDYTDIMHFAKKATDADVKKIRSLRIQYRDDIDDEDDAERVAKRAASYVKSVLAESKRRPSKRALKRTL